MTADASGGEQNLFQKFWLAITGLTDKLPVLLGAVGTLLGAIATFWSSNNASRIDNLKFQYQADAAFATAIAANQERLAQHDSGPDRAVAVYVSLYAEAETALQKLELIELAQTEKQDTSMLALSGIASGDPSVQRPQANDAIAASAITLSIRSYSSTNISAVQSPPPIFSTATGPRRQIPASDLAATQSSNEDVRSNAAVIAALPATAVAGWTFIGDASGADRDTSTAVLDPGTNAISSPTVPVAKSVVTACQDMNIRTHPFQNGELGQIVGIATRGSALRVDEYPPLSAEGLENKKLIAAKWIHVTLLQGADLPSSAPTC